jgi:Ca2+-binding EF-hand superfamily protein
MLTEGEIFFEKKMKETLDHQLIISVRPLFVHKKNQAPLTIHDLKCFITTVLGYRPSRAEVMQMFGHDNWDIEFNEFSYVMQKQLMQSDDRESLLTLFNLFDTKNKGYISLEDFELLCKEVFPRMDKASVVEAFLEADSAGFGRLSFQQFETLLAD